MRLQRTPRPGFRSEGGCRFEGGPHVFFTAIGGSLPQDLAGFIEALATSNLPAHALTADFAAPLTWDAAFTLLAQVLPTDSPSVVVLDEMPYLVREDPTFEGALQKSFDRTLLRLPVLLILIGSDLGMMEEQPSSPPKRRHTTSSPPSGTESEPSA